MSVIFHRKQFPEIPRHRGTIRRNSGDESTRLAVPHPPWSHSQLKAACRIGCRNSSQHGKCRCHTRSCEHVVFCERQLCIVHE